jgi:sporulation protein YlmC with PRC-barrel domain
VGIVIPREFVFEFTGQRVYHALRIPGRPAGADSVTGKCRFCLQFRERGLNAGSPTLAACGNEFKLDSVEKGRLDGNGLRDACEGRGEFMPIQSKITKTDPDTRYRRVLSASTLAGDNVQNSAGEDLGKVNELMIDIPSGRVAYAVLSIGGFLGMGNKLFAVPWSALRVDEDKKIFVLDVDKKKLENAPGFDKDNWPDMADDAWGTQIYSYYGAAPYWEERTFRSGVGL